jgi:hypothetical protein
MITNTPTSGRDLSKGTTIQENGAHEGLGLLSLHLWLGTDAMMPTARHTGYSTGGGSVVKEPVSPTIPLIRTFHYLVKSPDEE